MYEHAYSKNERYYYINSNELYHHGIKGQKWGVRRYQNADGSLTSAGRQRYGSGEEIPEGRGSSKRGLSDSTKKKLKTAATIGVALAVTAGVSVYLAKNPELAKKAAKYAAKGGKIAANSLVKAGGYAGKVAVKGAKAAGRYLVDHKDTIIGAISTAASKTGSVLGKVATKAGTTIGKSLEKASDAAFSAAAATLGAYAVTKIVDKYAEEETDSEKVKLAKKVAVESATAAIKAATTFDDKKSNKSKSDKGGQVGKEVTDAIGAPSNKGIDRQSKEYQNLFKDDDGNQLDSDTRSAIKSMASAGYDIDQLKEYRSMVISGELKHSGTSHIVHRSGTYYGVILTRR